MAHSLSPDRVYVRSWASEMLRRTHRTLRNYYLKKGRGREFDVLYPYLTRDEQLKPYRQVATELDEFRRLGQSQRQPHAQTLSLRFGERGSGDAGQR